MPGWRKRARAVVQQVVGARPDIHHDLPALKAALSAEYPFGMRQYTPYRIWLEEVAKALGELAAMMCPDALARSCPACGARAGHACKEFQGEGLGRHHPPREIPHEARMATPHPGPLFGGA